LRTLKIRQIKIGEDGRLLVVADLRPEENFAFIYRAGMEIGWSPEERALSSPAPRPDGWSHSDWFRQILRAAVEEYGLTLLIDGHTTWSVPADVRRQIESAVP
jgi:hypothetical protein